jgi:ribonuclease HIII
MAIPSTRTAEILARVAALTDLFAKAGYLVTGVRAIDYGRQVQVSDGKQTVNVNIYGGKKGISVVVAGAPGRPLRAAVSGIAAALGSAVLAGAAGPAALLFALDPTPGTSAAALPAGSGKTRPSAAAAPRSMPARQPVREAKQPHGLPPGPWIGSDESGKGDYFGPLVAAAVYVAPEQETALRAAGVRDSKLLDDGATHRVAAEIRRICAGRFAEEVLAPAEYNALYERFKAAGENLNHLLAWGHVHVLAALLGGSNLPAEPPPTVIADQFANERYVRERLQQAMREHGLPMPALLQMPRAEANVAVAAASILARDRFLDWLAQGSARYGIALPKGGSKPAIIAAARRIIERHGPDELAQAAKLHFATTKAVHGTGA